MEAGPPMLGAARDLRYRRQVSSNTFFDVCSSLLHLFLPLLWELFLRRPIRRVFVVTAWILAELGAADAVDVTLSTHL
ncbi:hypothetical protein DL770_001279 [Monosporascus sp. CRB-9-2]|nr:hypothetical protein DL770_001279 [Monosporascus sp. CRB-9-2]